MCLSYSKLCFVEGLHFSPDDLVMEETKKHLLIDELIKSWEEASKDVRCKSPNPKEECKPLTEQQLESDKPIVKSVQEPILMNVQANANHQMVELNHSLVQELQMRWNINDQIRESSSTSIVNDQETEELVVNVPKLEMQSPSPPPSPLIFKIDLPDISIMSPTPLSSLADLDEPIDYNQFESLTATPPPPQNGDPKEDLTVLKTVKVLPLKMAMIKSLTTFDQPNEEEDLDEFQSNWVSPAALEDTDLDTVDTLEYQMISRSSPGETQLEAELQGILQHGLTDLTHEAFIEREETKTPEPPREAQNQRTTSEFQPIDDDLDGTAHGYESDDAENGSVESESLMLDMQESLEVDFETIFEDNQTNDQMDIAGVSGSPIIKESFESNKENKPDYSFSPLRMFDQLVAMLEQSNTNAEEDEDTNAAENQDSLDEDNYESEGEYHIESSYGLEKSENEKAMESIEELEESDVNTEEMKILQLQEKRIDIPPEILVWDDSSNSVTFVQMQEAQFDESSTDEELEMLDQSLIVVEQNDNDAKTEDTTTQDFFDYHDTVSEEEHQMGSRCALENHSSEMLDQLVTKEEQSGNDAKNEDTNTQDLFDDHDAELESEQQMVSRSALENHAFDENEETMEATETEEGNQALKEDLNEAIVDEKEEKKIPGATKEGGKIPGKEKLGKMIVALYNILVQFLRVVQYLVSSSLAQARVIRQWLAEFVNQLANDHFVEKFMKLGLTFTTGLSLLVTLAVFLPTFVLQFCQLQKVVYCKKQPMNI